MSSLKRSFATALTGASLSLLLIGCIPTVQRLWDAQPVSGTIIDGDTGAPVNGATISLITAPEEAQANARTATSNAQGEFTLPGASHIGFHMAMPASYMASEKWVINHPNYPDAVAETVTIAPPTGEQPREITAPLFANLNTTPVEDCPYFHYQQRLAQWAQQHFSEEAQRPFQDALLTLCHDPERIEEILAPQEP